MSDDNQYQQYGEYDEYGYDDGGNYDENGHQEEEDYQTKVQLEYFQSEDMLRKGQFGECLSSLQKLYELSQQHNLRNWKPKILNLQLQIHCKSSSTTQLTINQILITIQKISQLNKKQKYTQSSIKSIIMTIKGLKKQVFEGIKAKVYEFINGLDEMSKVRSWLMLVEKCIEEGSYQEAKEMIERINSIQKKLTSQASNMSSQNRINTMNITKGPMAIPSSLLIELYSHQITLSSYTKQNISPLLNRIHLMLATLQTQSYLSDGHISIIKQSIAQLKYQQQNYIQCSRLLCQAFQEQMKYGKDHKKKKDLLKVNVLVSLLTQDKQLYMKDKHNALYNQAAASFKSQNDIQSLYGLVEAFNNGDYNQFMQQMKFINYEEKQHTPYQNLVQKVILLIKSNKLLQIIKPYTKIKFSYLARRLSSSQKKIHDMIFGLIMDGKIDGKMSRNDGHESYLVINEAKDEYLTVQLENIKQLTKKYL